MDASRKRTFYYHASANPIGGKITQPLNRTLTAHGSTALAQAGGHSVASAQAEKIDSVVSFDRARSEIYGHSTKDKGGHWITTVTSVVEKFNILDIVRADSMIARITVRHPHQGEHPWVSFAGTQFDNLTINNQVVTPRMNLAAFSRIEEQIEAESDRGILDEAAMQRAVPPLLTSSWADDPRTMGVALKHNLELVGTPDQPADVPKWVKERYQGKADRDALAKEGQILCSLVSQVNGSPFPSYGHIVHVPDVGNLFLGELSVKHRGFRLTMMRIEMGCLAEGDVSAAQAESDGKPMP